MLKQTIQFKDFNNKDQEVDLWFNLSEFELVDMQADSPNGIQADMMQAVEEKDMRKLLDFVKMLVNRSYGERDADGIHFHKSPEITQRFVNSAMYGPLLLSLFQDEGKRAETFITGLMPADLVQAAIAQTQGQGTQQAPHPFARPQDRLPKQQSAGAFSEAPVIGRQEFQAPIVPTQPEAEQYDVRNAYENNVEGPSPVPADAQPLQVGENSTEDTRTEVAPFRIEAEPLPEVNEEDAEKAEFRRWQQARAEGRL